MERRRRGRLATREAPPHRRVDLRGARRLSAEARGAAMSIHSFFFFIGHASGPVLYGLGFMKLGPALTISLAAIIVMLVGLLCARLLREKTAG